jgi:succinate dehydrogenase / fumarate reductase cytochrome b subunit
MKWITDFLISSIGRKLIMGLTGLFLVLFLAVHLFGNVNLLINDEGEAFTNYVQLMKLNPVIKLTAYLLYLFIILHSIQGTLLWINNRRAKGQSYAVSTSANASFAAKNMFYLGVLIFVFLVLHMGDFWLKMKTGSLDEYTLYSGVVATFKIPGYLVVYEIGIIALFFHLRHGFQSAFQTLGLNHSKYTPVIKAVGWLYSIVISLGYFIIPLYVYFVIPTPA